MENETVKENPAIMAIICTIQSMSEIIGCEIPFKELEDLKCFELIKIQDELVDLYNIHIKEVKNV